MFGSVNFKRFCRHFITGSTIDDTDLGSQSDRGSGTINGRISATHDSHFFTQLGSVALGMCLEKIHSQIAAFQVAALDGHGNCFLRTNGDIYSIILFTQFIQVKVLTHHFVTMDLHPVAAHQGNLFIQNSFGQTVFRDPISEPAAGCRGCFKNIDLVTIGAEIVAASQS